LNYFRKDPFIRHYVVLHKVFRKTVTTRKTSRRKFICTASAFAFGTTAYGYTSPLVKEKPQSIEEILKKQEALVDKYFPIYGTCSQTTFIALNETFNLKAEDTLKALASFPGIAFRGETCGAVSACLCGISLIYEGDIPGNKLSNLPCITFSSKFENEYGSTRCRDIIAHVTNKKYTIQKPEDYIMVARDGGLNHCKAVINKALKIATEIILEKA